MDITMIPEKMGIQKINQLQLKTYNNSFQLTRNGKIFL